MMEILRPHRSGRFVGSLALCVALVFSATGDAQSPATQEITRSVVRALERLPYPIHIIVKHGRTTLLGVVDNEADRRIAEVRAREVGGVFSVDNELTIHKP
jgi:osmotically-inducible protein OsmY